MSERFGAVKMKGNPLTLIGNEVKVGDKAPDFTVVTKSLSPASLASYAGKKKIISVVPSLDTGVCSIMTKRFNTEASKLGDDVVVLTISMDLPFAQARWCGAEGVDRVETLSDYMSADFGMKYGLLIKELRLLSRAVLVVDANDIVRYKELVEELTHEPDYNAALAAAKKI